MIHFILSPAKKMRESSALEWETTKPRFLEKSKELISVARNYSAADLEQIMKISTEIAEQNVKRFKEWEANPKKNDCTAAVLAFNGEVYRGLNAENIASENLDYLQRHVHILSGLYGLLRPLDEIMPYRLEMGRKIALKDSKNLPDFWKKTITNQLNNALGANDTLVNLASNEYAKAIAKKDLKAQWLDIDFLDEKNGELKKIMVYFKQARGTMARFAVDYNIEELEHLKSFDGMGYTYSESHSEKNRWIFVR